MNKDKAVKICDHIKDASTSLNEILVLLEQHGELIEFKNSRSYIAKIMGSMYFDLFVKLVEPNYPELIEYMETE